jgi:hypothetical protein
MPANFDSPLTIGASGFVEWPTGPLGHVDGHTLLRVEAWVMQQSTGGIQMTYQTSFAAGVTTWKADRIWYPKQADWYNGPFQPGAALGTAVLIWKTPTGKQHVYWWTEEVELV